MSRSSPNRESDGMRAGEGEAWGEFLSETSEELRILKSELHGQRPVDAPAGPGGAGPVEGLWRDPHAFHSETPEVPPAQPALPEPDRRPVRLALPPASVESPAAPSEPGLATKEPGRPVQNEPAASVGRGAPNAPEPSQRVVAVRPAGETNARPEHARRARRLKLLAAAIALAAAMSAGAWMVYTSLSSGAAARGTRAPQPVDGAPAAPAAVVPLVPIGPDPWALGSIGPFEPEEELPRPLNPAGRPRPEAIPAPIPSAETGRVQLPAGVLPAVATVAAPGAGGPSVELRAITSPPPPRQDRSRAAVPPANDGATKREAFPQSAGAQRPGRVYSSGDPDVQPPVLAPGQPRPLPLALPQSPARLVVELLIDERGVVQSATVIGRPQRWDEMMMLSSLKNQRYQPATKDGEPVAYRLRIQP